MATMVWQSYRPRRWKRRVGKEIIAVGRSYRAVRELLKWIWKRYRIRTRLIEDPEAQSMCFYIVFHRPKRGPTEPRRLVCIEKPYPSFNEMKERVMEAYIRYRDYRGWFGYGTV